MPIQVGIWKLGEHLERVVRSSMDYEARLEKYICEDLSILAPDLMLIGRQIPTDFGKLIDMLAIDAEGDLTVIELKRDQTPRDVVAQVLDYASWVQNLSYDDILNLYAEKNPGKAFEEGFDDAFGASPPEALNESHNLIIVAAELDSATERIINYLSDNYGVPINAIFFQCFKDGDQEYLTRTWLIDPQKVEVKASRSVEKKEQEPWNGQDFYVNFGDGSPESEGVYRSWEDARKYGFVSAGGGRWYSKPLERLQPGMRVFAYIPQHGYVGVGEVVEPVVPIGEFYVEVDGKKVPYLEASPSFEDVASVVAKASDPDKREYFVRVRWIKAFPKSEPFREKGLFANQSSVCQLRNRFTLEKLVKHFGLKG